MKHIKRFIASLLVVSLIIFTAVFVINAYNTGKLGNKDEKVASDFVGDIQGVWKNTSSGTVASKVTAASFGENGKLTVIFLGQTLNGTYSDSYDLDTKKHTLTVEGKIYGGLSVERDFDAVLNEDKDSLTLKDSGSSLEFILVRTDEEELTIKKTTTQKTTERRQESTTVLDADAAQYSQAILGKWTSRLSSLSGYEFVDGTSVKISLAGITTDGTYSVSVNENGRCEVKINYVNVAGVSVSNTYVAEITDSSLILIQKNAESVSVTYDRVS